MFVPHPFRPSWHPNSYFMLPSTQNQNLRQLERLTKRLDSAERKNDQFARIIASLYAELKQYQDTICCTCRDNVARATASPPTPTALTHPDFQHATAVSKNSSGTTVTPGPTSGVKEVTGSSTHFSVDSSLRGHDKTHLHWAGLQDSPIAPNSNPDDEQAATAHLPTRTQPTVPLCSASVGSGQSRPPFPSSFEPMTGAGPTQPPSPPDWSVEYNPKVKRKLSLHVSNTFIFTTRIFFAKFSRDGKYLALGLENGETHVYDMATGSKSILVEGSATVFQSRTTEARSNIWGVQFSPDNNFVATGGSRGEINIWEVGRRRIRATFKHTELIRAVDISPDGRFLVSGSYDRSVCMRVIRDGSRRRLWHGSTNFMSVGFSPNGQYVAAGNDRSTLSIWHVRTGLLVAKCNIGGSSLATLRAMAFTADGNRLASGGNAVDCWDVSWLRGIQSGRYLTEDDTSDHLDQIWEFNGHEDFITAVSFSSDNRWVVSSSYDHNLCILDARSGEWVCTLKGHGQRILAAEFSPAGHYLISGGRDRLVRLWRYKIVR